MSQDPLIHSKQLQQSTQRKIEACYSDASRLKQDENYIINLNDEVEAYNSVLKADQEHQKIQEKKAKNHPHKFKIPLAIKCIFYGLTGIFSPFWVPNRVKNKGWVYFFRFYSLAIIASAALSVALGTQYMLPINFALYVLVYLRLVFRSNKSENTVLFVTEFSLLAVLSNSRLITAVIFLDKSEYYLIIQYALATIVFNIMLGYMIERTVFKDETDNYIRRRHETLAQDYPKLLQRLQCNPDTYKWKLLRPGVWTEEMLKPWVKSHCPAGIPQYRGEWIASQIIEKDPIAVFKQLEQKIAGYALIQVILTLTLCVIFDAFFSPYNDMIFPCVFLIYESSDLKSKIYSYKFVNNCIQYYRKDIEDYPLLNIFDPLTMHCWNYSRKIFQRFRSIVTDIFDVITVCIFIVSIFYIFIELLHYFTSELGKENPWRSTTSISVAVIVLSLVLRRMYLGGQLNAVFDGNQGEITLIKKSVSAYLTLHKSYWDQDIIPQDDFHKDLFLETGTGKDSKCFERSQSKEKVECLLETLEDLELDIEKDNEKYSYKFLQIFHASPERFWELFIGIVISVTMIIVNYVWSEITGKESIFG